MIDLETEHALIEKMALENGFKLKQQPNGKMALNPYVFDFAEKLLAKKQAQIDELKQFKSMNHHLAEINSDLDRSVSIMKDEIIELKQKLARYENPDYVLVPKNSKTVVAIENMVYQQVEASGIDEPIHRLDGWRILDAIEESLEKDHAQQDS